MVGFDGGQIIGGANENIMAAQHRPQGLIHGMAALPGLVDIIDGGVALGGFGKFQGIVGHQMGIGLAVPNGLTAKMHGVVPMDNLRIDGFGPAEINFFNNGTEGAKDFERGNRVAADFRVNFDIAEIK